ncbi:MAG: phage portal protein family protein [Sodalis sp. (in: enterobacteria)]|uniref:phage portal protein family protein n=1 Tax=Sodalis sp. (in: enterobacteria) TaxID=1898979 RepID=UPI003F3D4CBD
MEKRDGHLFAEISKRRRSVVPLTWRIMPSRHPSAQEKAMVRRRDGLVFRPAGV